MTEAGEYFEYDDFWRDREEKKRSSTDKKSLFTLLMFVVLWIGIAIYAFNADSTLIPDHFWEYLSVQFAKTINNEVVQKALRDSRAVYLSFMWVSIWLLALYLYMLHRFTKYMIYFTIFLLTGFMIVAFIPLVTCDNGVIQSFLIPLWLVYLIMCFVMIYALKKEGTQVVSQVIQDSITAMISFPLSILIAICGSILIALVIIFAAIGFFYLMMIRRQEVIVIDNSQYGGSIRTTGWEYTPTYVYVWMSIFTCCSVWIIFFLNHFVRMILHGIFSTWYRTSEKKSISSLTTLRYLVIPIRYHSGTLAFGSTIFTKIQMLRVICSSGKDVIMEIQKRPVVLPCLFVIMANGTTNALVACIVHAKDFHQSMKNAFKLLLGNPLKYAATRMMACWMMFFGLIIIPLLSLAMPALYFKATNNEYDPLACGLAVIIVGKSALFFTLILMVVFNSAIEAVTFCSLEKFKADKADANKLLIESEEV